MTIVSFVPYNIDMDSHEVFINKQMQDSPSHHLIHQINRIFFDYFSLLIFWTRVF